MEPTSANASTSLRPRNRRRTNEDEDCDAFPARAVNHLDGAYSTGSSPRSKSPVLKATSLHATSSSHNAPRSVTPNRFLKSPGVSTMEAPPASITSNFLDNPWASLQNFATAFISNDRASGRSTPNRSPSRKGRSLEREHGGTGFSTPPGRWGPAGNGERSLGAGTRGDRIAHVQAKKREALLAANDQPNRPGHHKRRGSDDKTRSLMDNEDRDQLVYLHQVRPEDTLAGITIKYNCEVNVFRKANRLWPNDSIQIRKVVVLPVDACAIRGRKISETSASENFPRPVSFQNMNRDIVPPQPTAAHHLPWGDLHETKSPPSSRRTPASSIPTSPSISVATSNPEERPWTHDSWVIVDGFPDAVEIARLSCRTLGYFPRTRRKSLSLSDLDSPQPSFDLPRSGFQALTVSPRRRLSNTGSNSRSGSGSHFAKGLHGVGGVGTMGSNVRSPGPAQDGLNKMFAAHLPNLAPKESSESLRSSTSFGNGGLENMGGAIEGWVRKIATKTQASLQMPTTGGKGEISDLIELSEDVFDPGADGYMTGTDVDRRRNEITGWTSKEQEQMLHEHFPPRGRVFKESSSRGRST